MLYKEGLLLYAWMEVAKQHDLLDNILELKYNNYIFHFVLRLTLELYYRYLEVSINMSTLSYAKKTSKQGMKCIKLLIVQ